MIYVYALMLLYGTGMPMAIATQVDSMTRCHELVAEMQSDLDADFKDEPIDFICIETRHEIETGKYKSLEDLLDFPAVTLPSQTTIL